MTAKQRLQLEQLAAKKKLNELLGVDPGDLTDAQRAEMDTLTKRLEQSDTELRAAILAEGDDEQRALAADGGDGESAERRRLLDGVTIADYLSPASTGRGLEGRAAELNAALEVPLAELGAAWLLPWHVLETRAFTETSANDGSNIQRPILQRIFGPGIMDSLGVRMDTVPADRSSWKQQRGRMGRIPETPPAGLATETTRAGPTGISPPSCSGRPPTW